MPKTNLESCFSFVYAHRLAASLLRGKAEELLETLGRLDESDVKERLLVIANAHLTRATEHEVRADLQERDLGVKCYCTTRGSLQ